MSKWIKFSIWQPSVDRLVLDADEGRHIVDPEGASAYVLEIDDRLSLCIEGEDPVPIAGFDPDEWDEVGLDEVPEFVIEQIMR